jgi:hypothetical protein
MGIGGVQVNTPSPFCGLATWSDSRPPASTRLTLSLIQIYLPFELERLFGGGRNFLSGAKTNRSLGQTLNFAYASLSGIW